MTVKAKLWPELLPVVKAAHHTYTQGVEASGGIMMSQRFGEIKGPRSG